MSKKTDTAKNSGCGCVTVAGLCLLLGGVGMMDLKWALGLAGLCLVLS